MDHLQVNWQKKLALLLRRRLESRIFACKAFEKFNDNVTACWATCRLIGRGDEEWHPQSPVGRL